MIAERSTVATSHSMASEASAPADRSHATKEMSVLNTVLRWVVVLVLMAHALIHTLGAAQGLGWADVTQLKEPISTAMGATWLFAAALVAITGVLLARGVRSWWAVGAVAVLVSQAVILTSWSDAKAGTVANVILLVAVAFGYASQGSKAARWTGAEAHGDLPEGQAFVMSNR